MKFFKTITILITRPGPLVKSALTMYNHLAAPTAMPVSLMPGV